MNRKFSHSTRRKRFLTGLCAFLLMGVILGASDAAINPSALAADLPPGDYSSVGKIVRREPDIGYSPYVGDFPQQVFWGDTHLHTSYSFDVASSGNDLTPKDAYRFARGEEVSTSAGQRVRLSRPLDLLVVSDHSDGLGALEDFWETPRLPPRTGRSPKPTKTILQGVSSNQ